MLLTEKFKSVGFPLMCFVLFFVVQVVVRPSEMVLTYLAIGLFILILSVKFYKNEGIVFLFGLGLGFFIEVVLGLIARQQYWTNASLFGVPTWLPITWGIGFVIITRIGIKIEGLRD
jgi:hypothetical protein